VTNHPAILLEADFADDDISPCMLHNAANLSHG